jgi:site-specific recombinase XerD
VTTDNLRFQEYLKKKESFKCENKRYKSYWKKTLEENLQAFLQYREIIEKRAETTLDGDKRKLKRLFKFLTNKKLTKITLEELVCDTESFQEKLTELKKYLLEETEYSRNYVSGILAHINPFFKTFLQLDIHISAPAKKSGSFKRIRISEIDKFINHINKTYQIKIQTTNNQRCKQRYRRDWARERFVILTMKYTWARSIEICNIQIQDLNEMMKTSKIHLRSRKRDNNPKEYQDPSVPTEYLKEWEIYKRFRDSSDWSDDAPAITNNAKGIETRYIRYLLGRKYKGTIVLPDDFTCHNIRRSMHTLARHVFNNPKIAQLQLGDVSSDIANKHYNIPDSSLIQSELSKLYHSDHIPGEEELPEELNEKVNWGDYSYV